MVKNLITMKTTKEVKSEFDKIVRQENKLKSYHYEFSSIGLNVPNEFWTKQSDLKHRISQFMQTNDLKTLPKNSIIQVIQWQSLYRTLPIHHFYQRFDIN